MNIVIKEKYTIKIMPKIVGNFIFVKNLIPF